MSTDTLVSVIVITYNSAEYVVETLESIAKQSYPNIELIISDDASEDNTLQVCKDWISEHQGRFKACRIVAAEKNLGIPANCNKGVDAASGNFIKIIAGDDILLEDCIKDNLNFIEQSASRNIVISEMNAFLDGTTPKKILEHKVPFGEIFSDKFTAKDQNNFLIKASYFGNAPTLFYRKCVFDKVRFDESIPLLEDYPFAILATESGFKYSYLPKVTVLYRVRNNSAYFKGSEQIFGNFYKTKNDFDLKYRFSHLDAVSLNNEKMRYNIQHLFDKYNLNKNTFLLRFLYNFAHLCNPYRYLAFFKKRLSKK